MKICERIYLVGSGSVGISHLFDCHVYLIDGGTEMVLVDTGAGVATERILENVKAEGFDPGGISRILITHAHEDHAGGVARFMEMLHCVVMAAPEEAAMISTGGPSAKREVRGETGGTAQPGKVRTVADGESIKAGNLEVRAIIVPGHSAASTCYLLRAGGRTCLFSGDTVFINGLVGLLNSPGCEISSYRRSIGKLSGLDVDALLPGHHLFTIGAGQRHIDRAVGLFAETRLPPHIGMMGSNRS